MSQPDFNRLYEIAENQAGYFTARQAQTAGFSWERLSYYATTGRFSRLQRGIYRLVHFPGSPYEDLFVAWLRVGPDAAISHESALYLFGLSDVLPGEVHVIMPRTDSRRRKGIRLHTHRLGQDQVTWREGLPVTSPARTIIDVIAHGVAADQISLAIHQALRQGLADEDQLRSLAAGRGGRVRRVLESILETDRG